MLRRSLVSSTGSGLCALRCWLRHSSLGFEGSDFAARRAFTAAAGTPPPLDANAEPQRVRAALAGAAAAAAASASAPGGRTVSAASDAVAAQRTPIGGVPVKTTGPIKVKKKGPWGQPQLRDAWSEDAMARHDKDSVGERIKREYRYHPEEQQRQAIKWMAIGCIAFMPVMMAIMYWGLYGGYIWNGDWQHLFNIFRFLDTSPRSRLYYYHDPTMEDVRPRRLIGPQPPPYWTASASYGAGGRGAASPIAPRPTPQT